MERLSLSLIAGATLSELPLFHLCLYGIRKGHSVIPHIGSDCIASSSLRVARPQATVLFAAPEDV